MLDFPNRKLYLKRGLKSFERDREDKSGIKLINDNGHLVIGLIDKRGPAADAGLATGDVISRVNSTAVSGSDLTRARRVLKGDDGQEIHLSGRRGKETFEARFNLDKGFNYLEN